MPINQTTVSNPIDREYWHCQDQPVDDVIPMLARDAKGGLIPRQFEMHGGTSGDLGKI